HRKNSGNLAFRFTEVRTSFRNQWCACDCAIIVRGVFLLMSTNLSIKKWTLWLSMICGLLLFVIASTPLYAQENTYVKDENNHLSASQLDKLAKIAEKIKS